jgi:glycosyltransferase involved in cell wall biosynthesis
VDGKKVLIIAYYWPPSGGSGVQRWLKFVKYLSQAGWTPYVFTPENPSFSIKDESLLKDVPDEAEIIRFSIWEPYDAFFKVSSLFGGKKSSKPTDLVPAGKSSWFSHWSTWIRGNMFIPDPRVLWVKPSVKFLQDFIRHNDIHNVITTGPPHSLHLIGLRLKEKNQELNWIVDFRDPWSEWGLLDSLGVTSVVKKIHQRLERKILSRADHVTTITPFYVRQFEQLGNRSVQLLTNGFDEDDFRGYSSVRPARFIIRHVGIVNEKCNPRPFMLVLQELMDEDKEFAIDVQVDFVGDVHLAIKTFVEDRKTLKRVIHFTPTVPHDAVIGLYYEAAALLLVLTGYKDAEGYMPGKLFEYIATGHPVIGAGPDNGDAADLLETTGVGIMTESPTKMKAEIKRIYSSWKKGVVHTGHTDRINIYSRKEITGKLITLLK